MTRLDEEAPSPPPYVYQVLDIAFNNPYFLALHTRHLTIYHFIAYLSLSDLSKDPHMDIISKDTIFSIFMSQAVSFYQQI